MFEASVEIYLIPMADSNEYTILHFFLPLGALK